MHDFKKHPELSNAQLQIYYWDSPHRQITEDFIAKVVKVVDGDTVRLNWEERNFDFPLRMIKIDAPDEGSEREVSKRWLEEQILGEEVEIALDKARIDKWGRVLGDVIHQGRSMANLSLDLGYSVPFGDRGAHTIPEFKPTGGFDGP